MKTPIAATLYLLATAAVAGAQQPQPQPGSGDSPAAVAAPPPAAAARPAIAEVPPADVDSRVGATAAPADDGASNAASATPAADPGSATPGPQARPLEPGEMTHAEAVAYFKELRQWRRHRYDHPFTVGIVGGYGWVGSSRDVNPHAVGFGATLGYTFPIHDTYLGMSLLRFAGGRLASTADAGSLRPGDYSAVRVSADVGREFIFQYLRARALAMGGATVLNAPAKTKIIPTFGFGGSLILPIGMLYLGADLRFDFVLSTKDGGAHSSSLLGTVGLRL